MDATAAEARLTELWWAHEAAVSAFVRRRVGAAEADDLVNEVFLVVWRRLDAIPEAVRPWLLCVARNVVLSRARSEGRRRAYLAKVGVGAAGYSPDAAGEALDRLSAERAWLEIPEADREVLALVAWDGLAPDDAAAVLGCSRPAFNNRLLRARKKLAAALSQSGEAPTASLHSMRGAETEELTWTS
jgi:RNA polymerase sigma-70 factor (ECF subfamily)